MGYFSRLQHTGGDAAPLPGADLATSIGRHLGGGAAAGLAAGILLCLLDLALISSTDRTARVALLAAGLLLPTYLAGGALAGLAWCGLQRAATLGRRLGLGPATTLATTTVLLALPAAVWLVQRLTSGRQAAQLLGASWKKALLVALLLLLLWALVWASTRLVGWIAQRRGRAWPLLLSLLLFGLGGALFLADARLYRRLYDYLHVLVWLAYSTCGMVALLAAWRALRPARAASRAPGHRGRARGGTRRAVVATASVVLVTGVVLASLSTRRALATDQQARFVLLELTTVTAKVLAALAVPSSESERPLFLALPRPADSQPAADGHGFRIADANVVLVTVDALRADHLGAYGYSRPTSPNIDALAARGVRFANAYCQAPLTCYSIPSLHTGDYLHSTLALLPTPPPTLAQILGAHGYATFAFYHKGLFFCDDQRATGYGTRRFGFRQTDSELLPAPALTDRAIGFLRSFRDRQARLPPGERRRLFLWIHYFDPHEPYRRHPDHDFGDRNVDRYDSEIAYADAAIGRLVAALGQLPQPTILILSSDHGEEFGEHGGSYHGSSLYDEQVRVPLIIAAPGLAPRVVPDPVELVDLPPTVLSLLGLRIPESIRGRSLVPQLLGHLDPQRAAHSEVHTKKMVRVGEWKLIHDYRRSTYELYDLESDPQERRNVYARQPRVAARLEARLQSWFDQLRSAGAAQEQRPPGVDLGRIGDRRAVPKLAALVSDPLGPPRWRREAASLLGQLQDRRAADALWQAACGDDRLVAAESAIALGELKDLRARVLLPAVVQSTDSAVRLKAAIALARVDSPAATPALLEALASGSWELQNRAAHYLGFVGDRRAIGPLIEAARHVHLRSRAAVALGQLGRRERDSRILPFLLRLVINDRHPDVRHRALAAISFVGDRSAVRPLLDLLASDVDLGWTPEALTRLGAVGREVPGIDFSPERRGLLDGWGRCHSHESRTIENYLGSTWCATAGARATARFEFSRRPFDAQLLLRVRALAPEVEGRELTIEINDRTLPPVTVGRGWRAHRIPLPRGYLRQGTNRAGFRVAGPRPARTAATVKGWIGVDYLLLAPRARVSR